MCPSVQDKFVLLRLHKKGVTTQLSTWQVAPFRHRQVKSLDQGRKKQYQLHPDVEKFLADSIKSHLLTLPEADPHTFFYQTQK